MTKKLRKLRENNQTLFPKILDSQTTLDDMLICVIFYVGSKIEQKSIQEVSIGKMKIILKIYTLIFLLALPSPYLKAHSPNELSLRRAKGDSALSFLREHPGKVYSLKELIAMGFSELELSQLVADNRLVEIQVGSGYAGKDYRGNFYLLPREAIISQELIRGISQEEQGSGPRVKYFVHTRTIDSFRRDLENIMRYWEAVYRKNIGEEGLERFRTYFMPEVIRIIGDDLEAVASALFQTYKRLFELWNNLKDLEMQSEAEIDYSGRINLLLADELQRIRRDINLRETYGRQHNAAEELSQIVSSVKAVLKEYEDRILGIIIQGSWARGRPTDDSDLDFVIISEQGIDEELAEELQEKIEDAIDKKTSNLLSLTTHQLIMENPDTFRKAFNFDGTREFPLYVRNFVLIAKDEATLKRITSLILEAQPSFRTQKGSGTFSQKGSDPFSS